MNHMFIQSTTVNLDIIKEDDDKLMEVWPKDGIHGSLKRRGSIAQSEGHHFEFIVAPVRAKGSFTNILFMHANLMIALKKVQFGELASATKFIRKFINGGNRKAILDGNGF